MGKKSGGGAPPDYDKLLRNQFQATEQAFGLADRYNTRNQYSPWGSTTYEHGGRAPTSGLFDAYRAGGDTSALFQPGASGATRAYPMPGARGGKGKGGVGLKRNAAMPRGWKSQAMMPRPATSPGAGDHTGGEAPVRGSGGTSRGPGSGFRPDPGMMRGSDVPPLGRGSLIGRGPASGPDPENAEPTVEPWRPPDEPVADQVVRLNPAEQAALDKQRIIKDIALNRVGQNIEGATAHLGTPLGTVGTPRGYGGFGHTLMSRGMASHAGLPGLYDHTATGANRVGDAIYRRGMRRLEPRHSRDRESLEGKLSRQGIPRGSRAYNDALDRLDRAHSEERENLFLSADAARGAEHSRLFGLSGAARGHLFGEGLQNIGLAERIRGGNIGARRSEIDEMLMRRSTPYNELMSVLGGTAVGAPQFRNMPQYGPQVPDVFGQGMANYRARLQGAASDRAGLFGALGNVAGAAIGAGMLGPAAPAALPFMSISDRRLKKDIRRVGATDAGLPVYTFRYAGDPTVRMGVMADEVKAINPGAVKTVAGYDFVDYAQVT